MPNALRCRSTPTPRFSKLISSGRPLHAKFARLTRQEETKELFDDTAHIGTRRGWQDLLSEKGLKLRGHRLIRDKSTRAPSS